MLFVDVMHNPGEFGEYHPDVYHSAECHSAKCYSGDCHSATCHPGKFCSINYHNTPCH